MNAMEKAYPDISPILTAKAERRRALAALSWEEKVAIIEQMQRLQPKGVWKRTEAPINENDTKKIKTVDCCSNDLSRSCER